jgi:glycosyltransferase involved in cell wall biosynthesis
MEQLADYLVSIVTPSYNQAQFLEQTIASVLSQDYPHIQYIIIDGNSSDGSVDIIRKHAAHLAYWVSEPDTGQVDALQKGFMQATGDIFCWLNSDDIYLSTTVISSVVKLFLTNPQAQVITGAGAFIDEQGQHLRAIQAEPLMTSYQNIRCRNMILQPATFFKRDILARVPLDSSLNYVFDWDFWIRLAKETNFLVVEQAWAGYRWWRENKTASRTSKRTLEQAQVLRRYLGRSAWQYWVMRGFYAIYRFAEMLPHGPEHWLKSVTHKLSLAFSKLTRKRIPVA